MTTYAPLYGNIPPISVIDTAGSSADQTADCAICTEPMTGHDCHSLEPCNHRFHSGCIIQWFRDKNSSCPLCRQRHFSFRANIHSGASFDRLSGFERIAFQKYVKSPKANKKVIRLFHKYLKAIETRKAWAKEVKEFKAAHKDILEQYQKLRSKEWGLDSKVRRAVYSLHTVPVVPYVVHIRRNVPVPRDTTVPTMEAPEMPEEVDYDSVHESEDENVSLGSTSSEDDF